MTEGDAGEDRKKGALRVLVSPADTEVELWGSWSVRQFQSATT